MDQFTAAVIGCGRIGAGVDNYKEDVRPGSHADAYRNNADVSLVGLVEPTQERRAYLAAEYADVPVYEQVSELFASTVPDIVSIASPTQYHYDVLREVVEYAPKAILCEKPLAYDIEHAKEMVQLCEEKGIHLFVNHQRHFDPLLRSWASKIHAGEIGKVIQGTAFYYNGWFNNGTHLIDLLRVYLGDIVAVRGEYNDLTSWNNDDRDIDARLSFASGARVNMHALPKNYGYFGFSLFGEAGMIEVTNLGFEVRYRKKIDNRQYPGFYELSEDVVVEGAPRSMIVHTIAHIVDVLANGTTAFGTGSDGLAVMETLNAVKESAEAQGNQIACKI